MTAQQPGGTTRRVTARLLVLGAAFGLCGVAGTGDAAEGPQPVTAGTSLSAKGMLLRRAAPDKAWELVPRRGALPAGDLILGLPGAAIDSSNGAVRLDLLTDIDQRSPYPVLEAAVRLHRPGDFDL